MIKVRKRRGEYVTDISRIYHDSIPEFLQRLAETPAMQRLCGVGMNCGCEYTSFPEYRLAESYSRYDHSLGAALITWHFSGDTAASAAALMHDIASPVFAHTVDFLNGDYERQESTELGTAEIISSSPEIISILKEYGLAVADVSDYHRYPIADNDSPRLSADRLEYTLGNTVNLRFAPLTQAETFYRALCVTVNEDGEPELAFRHAETAEAFGLCSLRCSAAYVAPQDRYAMQRLSELLEVALRTGVLKRTDLYRTEKPVILALEANNATGALWREFRELSRMVSPEEYPEAARVIPAKKRRIDPLVIGEGRLSTVSRVFRDSLDQFMAESFLPPIAAIGAENLIR